MLNDTRLSKDMQATPRAVKGCWPRACRAQRSLTTCTRSIRPTTHVCGGSSHQAFSLRRIERLRSGSGRSSAGCSTHSPRPGPTPQSISCPKARVPAAVHRHLRAARCARGRSHVVQPGTHGAALPDRHPRAVRARQAGFRCGGRPPDQARQRQRLPANIGHGVGSAPVMATTAWTTGNCCRRCCSSSSPATTPTTSLVGNGVVALAEAQDPARFSEGSPRAARAAGRRDMRYETLRASARQLPATPPRTSRSADLTIPKGGQVIISLAAANRDGARFSDAERLQYRHRADNRQAASGTASTSAWARPGTHRRRHRASAHC